jgi:hypothetical protein
MDGLGDAAVDQHFSHLRRQMRRTTPYSRLTYDRRIWRKSFATALFALVAYASGWLVYYGNQDVPAFWKLSVLDIAVTLFIGAVALVSTSAALLTLHSLFTYPGCPYAATVFGEARNVLSESLRRRYAELAAFVESRALASFELKLLAASAAQRRREDDLLSNLKEGRGLYLSIELLTFSEDARLARLLTAVAVAGGGNAYSRAALETLHRRALADPNDREALEELAASVWKNEQLDWKYRRAAGRALSTFDPAFRAEFRRARIVRSLLQAPKIVLLLLGFYAATYLFTMLVGVVVGLSQRLLHQPIVGPVDVTTPLFWKMLIATWLLTASIIGAALYWHARRTGIRRIPGYLELDAWPPMLYGIAGFAVSLFTFNGIAPTVYLLNRKRIRANARGLDLDAVRALLKPAENPS